MRFAIAAVGIALLCFSTVSVGTEIDEINARIRARNAELKGQPPQKVRIDASDSGGSAMTTEQANEYYGRINRGTKAQADQADQERGAVPSAATSGRGSPEQRNRLAAECARGINRSCATLKMLNGKEGQGADDPIPTNAATSAERDRLANECNRGFKKSCTALRALNGEQEKRTTVCTSSGTTQSLDRNGDLGTYNGVTVCR